MNYSSISRRFAALLMDAMILTVFSFIVHLIIPVVGAIVISLLYAPILESSEIKATIGKHLMGIQVTDLAGRRISFGTAIVRYLMKLVSSSIMGLGYVVAIFTNKRQALHDLVAETVVVYGRNEIPVSQAWADQAKAVFRMNESKGTAQNTQYKLSELERLQALREKGTITDEEFAREKAKILGGG